MKANILMYHDVFEESVEESGFQSDGANHYKVPVTSFEEQISRLKDYPITLTFDDGGVSSYTLIAPILERHGIRGHFYIASDKIGCEGFMTENQIRELHKRGHIIGSHSCSHPSDIRVLSFGARKIEWDSSVRKLNDIIGEPIKEVSIPNGFFQKEDLPIFKALGIATIYTSKIGEKRQYDGMEILGRVGIDKNMSLQRIEKILSGGGTYKVLVIKQEFISVLKTLMGNQYITFKAIIRRLQK